MNEKTIDLREIYYIIRKNIRLIVKFTSFCIAIAILYLIISSPVYQSEALLRIRQPKGLGSSILDSLPVGNVAANKQLMSTYAEILKSRSVVVPVMEKMESPDREGKYPSYESYVARITTVPFRDTELMKVSVNYPNVPEKAQEANQLLVDEFLRRLTELSRAEQKATRLFIEERVVDSEHALDNAESALNRYRKDNKIISPTDQMQLIATKLAMIDKLEAENKVALSSAQAKRSSVSNILTLEAKVVADNATIKQYTSKLSELEAQRISYMDKYTDRHPRMQEINAAIIELRQKARIEVERVAALESPSDNPVHQRLIADKFAGQAEAAIASSNLEEIQRLNKSYENDIGNLSEKEQEFLKLARNRNVNQEIYVMLSKRLEEAKVAEVSVSTEVQVVDEPTMPDAPIRPRKALTVILATMLGVLISSGFVLAKELMNKTVKSVEDVQSIVGLPVLAHIPDIVSLDGAINEPEQKSGINGLLEHMWRKIWKKN